MYQLVRPNQEGEESHTILRLSDHAYIPMDEGNMDYKAYLKWVAAGNTPQAAPAPTGLEDI